MDAAEATIIALARLKAEAESRLRQHPDYRVILALDLAIDELRQSPHSIAPNIDTDVHPVRPSLCKSVAVTQANAAADVLLERGKPMRTVDLVEPVRAKGARVSQNKPEASLSSSLSADCRFEVVTVDGRSAWRLKPNPG